jgi:protein phosphatase
MPTLSQRKHIDSQREAALEDHLVPAAITDTGCERELNEDRYAVIEAINGVAWVVCDGMGGAKGGELAAQLVIDAIRNELENQSELPPSVAVQRALFEANRVICVRRQNPAFSEMGTTVVLTLFAEREVVVGHVGDSRAYLVRDAAVQQLTKDHTFVQDLVDQGKISQEEAMSHPQAHVLTRCMGSNLALPHDLSRFWIWEAEANLPLDYVVLCSDGLYSLVSDGELASIVSTSTPQRACVNLVELARARGGYDNITVAIVPLAGQLRNEEPPSREPSRKVTKSQSARPLISRGWMMMILGMLTLGILFAVFLVIGLVN